MNLMANILDRSVRVARAAAAATAAAPDGNGDSHDPAAITTAAATTTPQLPIGVAGMISQLRQRMPEVQTLLGLRDKLGGGSGSGGGGSGSSGGGGARGGKATGQVDDKAVVLRWRLLTLLDRYSRAIPGALAAARFDFLKLLPPSSGGGGGGVTSTVATVGAVGAMGAAASAGMVAMAATGLETLHPLLQLATFRLLSREGVVASTQMAGAGGGGAGGHSFGWFAQKNLSLIHI